jgi:uncharacterized protein YidB (DUF937 family)
MGRFRRADLARCHAGDRRKGQTMGLLDAVTGMLGGAAGGAGDGNAALLNAVVGLLGQGGGAGGLAGLVQQFEQGGLGQVIGSWVSTGQNLPISAEQLQSVLGGNGMLAGLAQQTGLSHGDLAGQLSQLLPQVVDQLTPNGQLPTGGLGDVGSLLGGLLGR